jgi:NDMA-dependent alcohol dehydrogenase
MTTGKAALLTGWNKAFEVQEIEWKAPRDDEVGVRIEVCGVCHSDLDMKTEGPRMGVPYPILTGHEGGGIVEEVGRNVRRVKPGDKVILSFIPGCGRCPSCVAGQGQLCDRGAMLLSGIRDDGTYRAYNKAGQGLSQFCGLGAYGEYVVVREDSCIPVEEDLDLGKVAIVGCRIPTGWGSVINVAKAKQGCTGLVVGLGGVGFSVIQGLKSVGAVVIIAVDTQDKKKWALEWGATHYIDASKEDVLSEVMKITGIGVDYAFDAIGEEEVQALTVEAICKGGTAVWIGAVRGERKGAVAMNSFLVMNLQKRISGSLYGGASPLEAVPQLLKMYRAGKIRMDEYVTKEYRLEQINEAYADMLAGKNICGLIRLG